MTVLADLISETLRLTIFFWIGSLVVGLVSSIAAIRRNTSYVGPYGSEGLWRVWRWVMICGVGIAGFAVAAGLLTAGFVLAIGSFLNSATSGHFLEGFYSSSSVTCTTLLAIIGMIAVSASLFGALAGVVQSFTLGRVIEQPISLWIRANIQVWGIAITAGVLFGLVLGTVAGSFGLNIVLFLAGAAAGSVATDRMITAAVQTKLSREYGAQQEVPPQKQFSVPNITRENVLPVVMLVVVAIGIGLLMFAIASSPGRRAASSKAGDTAPQMSPTPNKRAATFCKDLEGNPPSATYVCLGSEQGDPVASGGNWIMTKEASNFSEPRSDGRFVEVKIYDGSWWDVHFAAPSGEYLRLGTYNNATGLQEDNKQPTIYVRSGNHKVSCTGSYEVLALEYNSATGELTRFSANFVQTCNGTRANLYGSVRLNMAAQALTPP